jgi:hypothetical protein
MPLKKGSSQKTISSNIKELYHANEGKAKPRPRAQIIAIAESEARRTGRKKK